MLLVRSRVSDGLGRPGSAHLPDNEAAGRIFRKPPARYRVCCLMSTTEAPQSIAGPLRDAAVSGVRWTLAARVVGEAVQLAASVALARLVGPAEFGHAAIALILVPLSTILTFEGFGSALVQRRQIERSHVEAATLASILSGLALSVVAYAAAPLVVAPLFGARTAHLVQLAAPLFLIAAVSAVPRSLLWRKLEFRQVSLIETASMAVGAGTAVGLAVAGLEGESIVLGGIATTAVCSGLMIAVVGLQPPRMHGRALREVLGFGGPASGAGLLQVMITNVDYTILAARLDAAQVGLYWRAFQLGVAYQEKLSGIMVKIAFPLYSRTEGVGEMRHLHERATRLHAAVLVPLLALFIVLAPVLIPWLFGAAWAASVQTAQILALAGMIAAVLAGFPQVMLARGRSRELLRFNLVVLVVYASAVLATVDRGIVAVAVAVVVVYVAKLVAVYALMLRRVLGMPIRGMIHDLAPAALGSAVLAVVGLPLVGLLQGSGASPAMTVGAVAAVGAVIHCAILRALFPSVWHDLSTLMRRVLPSRLPLPGAAAPTRRSALVDEA